MKKNLEIVLDNLNFSYDENKMVLRNLSYNFKNNFIYGISESLVLENPL